jgi:hypothetical protein
MNFLYPVRIFFLLVFILVANQAMPQCMSYPVPLEQRINQSAYIVQGKVVEQHCYIDPVTGFVNTLNKFRVAAWLKNYSPAEDVYIITLGGVYGNKAMIVTPSLQLDMQHEYLLMLEADNNKLDDKNFRKQHPQALQLLTYADAQGSLTNENNYYHDLYYRTPKTEANLFTEISNLTNQVAVKPSGERFVPRDVIIHPDNGIAAISSFSPDPTNAGTVAAADQLTISGSGFGAGAGTVFYTNADDGGATFTASGIATDNVSWADGSIVNKPARAAGTGPINVNGAMTSATSLTITYSHLNINSSFSGFGSTTRQRYFLVNKNGLGGYTFTYNTAFAANTPAKNSFERGLLTWRCNTFVNFWRDYTTTSGLTTAAQDGVNLVVFDASLPVGVLGRATSYFFGSSTGLCNLSNTVWWADELDMQFAPDPPVAGFTWQYGPALPTSSQYDFESVALHELGHHHGLGHVIDGADVMNYALFNGATSRLLNSNNIGAGNAKMTYSTAALCFTPATVVGPMTALTSGTCTLPFTLTEFRGERRNITTNYLVWTTEKEINTQGYYLERSADAVNFNILTFINGSGNSDLPKQYEYLDTKAGPLPWYYRLRQLDFNGQQKNSKTIFVGGDDRNTSKVWANEPGTKITVFIKLIPNSNAVLRILNSTGQQVLSKPLKSDMTEIETGQLPRGIYFYQLLCNQQTVSGKLILGSE